MRGRKPKREKRGGVKEGAGRPKSLHKKKQMSFKFHPQTLHAIERYAKLRRIDRTAALEMMVQEYDALIHTPGQRKINGADIVD